MNFLPDVYVTCKACGGHRYNRETLEVKYKGKNIDDVLNMTVNMAVEFFANIPSIHQKLKAIQDVGLGYLTLGQPCTTLSGGESQRIKLSSELSKRDTGRTLYILDEPEAALSPQRLMSLMIAIDELVEENSQFVIATHSPILMTYPKAEILEMTDTGIHKVKYSETEHYKITKQFLDDPERMLRYLFRD